MSAPDPSLPPARGAAASVPLVLFERMHRFVELERAVRRAADTAELAFLVCNRTRDLVTYRQAVLWQSRGDAPYVAHASGVAEVDGTSPYVRALEALLAQPWAAAADPAQPPAALPLPRERSLRDEATADGVPPEFADIWRDDGAPFAVYVPLTTDASQGLLLLRDAPLQEAEAGLLRELQELYAHALRAFAPPPRRGAWRARFDALPRRARWGLAVAALAVALFPVRLSVLAPAQLVAKNPAVLTAPLNGVVSEVLVAPSATVRAGQPLYRIDDREIGSRLAVAEEELAAAEERLRQSAQRSFDDAYVAQAPGGSGLGALEYDVARARAERDYVAELARRVLARAPIAGVAMFSSPQDWIGRPVKIGEKVMEVALPHAVEVEAWLPAADAIPLRPGDDVAFYPEAAPLAAVHARVRTIAYLAEPHPQTQALAYRVRAAVAADDIGDGAAHVGRLGTARLHGERTVFAYLLLRAPANALRQWLGW